MISEIMPHNSMFNPIDSLMYYYMLKEYQPKLVIEVGSGHSSMIALKSLPDARFVFIDRDFTRFDRLVGTYKNYTKINKKLEYVDLELFRELDMNDFLFIDSSHKNGDVDYYLNKIFPVLRSGVMVHVHDIYYPEWAYPSSVGHFHWNEMAKLRENMQDFVIAKNTNAFRDEEKQVLLESIGAKPMVNLSELGCSLYMVKINGDNS